MDKQPSLKLEKKRSLHSNERTFLSYVRTSMSVLVLAVALFKFFETRLIIYIGWFVLVGGIVILLIGVYRYYQEKRDIGEDLE
ncbi:MAG: DUF202 domain-containing protein [Candidatus Magasanikbacteria bacterium]|jgi:uncharacterized membrane protein YidH (DUF202 family)